MMLRMSVSFVPAIAGPEFDGHLVDFDELSDRLTTYREFEERAKQRCAPGSCKIDRG